MFKNKFWVLLVIGFVDYLGIGLVYPIFATLLFDTTLPLIPEGASSAYRGAALGILIALTPLVQFFSSPLLGNYSDIAGRKKALQIGILTGCTGYFFAVLGLLLNSLASLFLYRFLVGISNATAGVAQAALTDISDEKSKAKRFAFLSASFGVGFTIGPCLGGIIADPKYCAFFSPKLPFLLAGMMSLANFFLVSTIFPKEKTPKEKKSFKVFEVLGNFRKVVLWKHLRWVFIAGFALNFSWAYFNEFIPVLLKQKFAFSSSEIGFYYGYGGVWYALSAAFGIAPLVARFKNEKLIAISLSIAAALMLFFALISQSAWIWGLIPFLAYAIAIAYPTINAIVSNRAGDGSQGEVLGIYQSIQACAMGISPLFVGTLVGIYPESAAIGGAFVMVLASLAFKADFNERMREEKSNP